MWTHSRCACPNPFWWQPSNNLPGAFLCHSSPADTVWLRGSLNSAGPPLAAASPREQIWAYSSHTYGTVRPCHFYRVTSHVKGAIPLSYAVGAILAQLIVSPLAVSLFNWASLTPMFVSVSRITFLCRPTPQACLFLMGTFSAQKRNSGENCVKTETIPSSWKAWQLSSMLEIVQKAQHVLLVIACSAHEQPGYMLGPDPLA